MKRKILEYYEGDPDYISNYETGAELGFRDTDAIAFGFFPISLDKDYEFFSGATIHRALANQAALKIVGRALSHVSQEYIDNWMTTEAYDKSYGIGRFWKDNNIISFWEAPCDELLIDIVKRLGIYDNEDLLIVNDSGEFTLDEYINNFEYVEDCGEKMDFRIDPKVAETIRSYNQPAETWQSQKEKEGWNTLAQRNATIYQEGKEMVNEYFAGDPDTVGEYDDETRDLIRDWNYRDPNVISFGYFQTSIDGEKEFIYKLDICHYDIAAELAEKVIGKAIASEDINNHEVNYIRSAIYHSAAYKGRIFLDPKIVTTWYQVKPEKLAELLNMMGGVEKYADYTYVCESLEKNVMEYIKGQRVPPEGSDMDRLSWLKAQMEKDSYSPDEGKMKDNITKWIDSRIVDIIRAYNTPNSTLAAKTSKLGNMTIAQYNSLIHQEGKEPKQTIKENDINMKNNKYQEEFSNYISIMTEALQKEDYKAYDYVKEMLDEAVEDSKHEKELMNEMDTTNFGVLNHIFESELPTLIKTNKKAVKKVINTIKEDKNLLGEFNFYNLIKQYNGKIAEDIKSDLMLSKINEAACKSVDKKTVLKSNQKFKKVMMENNIIPSDFVDNDSKKLYEAGHIILTKPSTLTNLYEASNSFNTLRKYMDDHKDDKKSSKDVEELVREFEEKLKSNLNESEMSFVQQITDFRSPIAEQRKEKLFNKFKNECIDKINTMLKEDANNDELKALSEQISSMQFNKESIVKDIAKLLEIRDILMDD